MVDGNDETRVGYRNPPQATRFRPGQSGNPRGRPKGTRNLLSDLSTELQATVTIIEKGKQIEVSKQLAIVKSLVSAAIEGDTRATMALVNLAGRIDAEGQDNDELSADERDIVDAFQGRTECKIEEPGSLQKPGPNPSPSSNPTEELE